MRLPANAQLLRGFSVDFLTAHDLAVVERIMDPGYRLSIGGHVFEGRDDSYLPATAAQLELFPGLCVTVHDVVLSPDSVAMRFTEHGVSANRGTASSWGGIAIFQIENGRLRYGWAEEDYFARKLQLNSGQVDGIRAPHPAPWDQPLREADPRTEIAMRHWFADPVSIFGCEEEISSGGPQLAELIDPIVIEVSHLFSADSRGAFHAVVHGTYRGGFAEIDRAHIGTPIELAVAGIVDASEERVSRVQLCGDRLGLQRHLMKLGR